MGFLNFFFKRLPTLTELPAGSFTVDRDGRVIAGTVSSSFPCSVLQDIGRHVLSTFKKAHEAQMPLGELIIHYPALKIIARELRGGAIVFLSPKSICAITNSAGSFLYAQ